MTPVGSRWLAFVAAWLLVVVAARAQLATGAHATGKRGQEHAWAVTPSTVSNDWGLWHIPPRFGRGGAGDGEVRIVGSLERQPTAMAASGGRVWLAFAGSGNRPGYGLLTSAVQAGAIDGTWYTGSGGRLASAPYLATTGKLVAMGAGPRGPIALITTTSGSPQIAWLERGAWRWADGPEVVDAPPPSAIGVLADGTVCLAAMSNGAIMLHRAALPEIEEQSASYELVEPDAILSLDTQDNEAQASPAELEWTSDLSGGTGLGDDAYIVAGPVSVGDRVTVTLRSGSQLHVVEVDGSRAREIYATVNGGVALLGSARRGLVVRLGDEAESAQGRAATRLVVDEFSLDTGRTFYEGPAVFDGPVSPSDIRILMVLMILVSASLLLFVVRTTSESKPFIPPLGTALAPPMPRLLASITDGLLAFLLGGELARLLPEGWLAMRVGADVLDFGPIVMALALGFVAGSVLEAMTGRTPGKLIFGLYVSRPGLVDGEAFLPRRPGIGASLARNAVKWLLPLVAFAGATSPGLRHRGDTMAGLGVIGEAAPQPGTGQSDQDRRPDDR